MRGSWTGKMLTASVIAAGCGGSTAGTGPVPNADAPATLDGAMVATAALDSGDPTISEHDAADDVTLDDDGGSDPRRDPGTDAADEAPGDSTDASAGDGPTRTDAGPDCVASPPVTFSACIVAHCGAEATACIADCACNDAVASAIACIGSGGTVLTCTTASLSAAVSTSPAATALATCLQQLHTSCPLGA